MSARAYLDWNATAPLRPEARAAMLRALDLAGNPSSVHAEGRAARAAVERARAQVAAAVGCAPGEVIFTSGATEAAQVLSLIPGPLLVDPTAHDALWSQADGGRRAGAGPWTFAMGLANSETGVIAALPQRGEDGRFEVQGAICDRLVLDVTQAVGRVPFSFAWSGADAALLSAHKLGGPKGVGALILRDGLDWGALARGGGQETGRRAGTENVAGIAGFGAAAEAALIDLAVGAMDRLADLRNLLERTLAAAFPATIFVGQDADRLPNTSCIGTPGWKAETQVMQMDLAGFAVSAGSACSSGKVRASRVLLAMGLGEEVARSAVRVSLGVDTTRDEVERFAAAWILARRKFEDRHAAPARRREG
jgi:cysteine desulfurase